MKPLLSVYTTVYNNARIIRHSLDSIIRALESLNLKYEIVIVDNYSDDGTFEILLEYSRFYPIRVYRYRCSRGLGRQIAFRFSRGEYVLYADLDTIYNPQILKSIIKKYLEDKTTKEKCLSIIKCPFLCPKKVIEEISGFKPLNRSEDVDLLTRLIINDLTLFLPPIKGLFYNEPVLTGFRMLRTFMREKRYSKGFIEMLNREIRTRIDSIIGSAVSLKKIILEHRNVLNYNILMLLISVLTRLPFILIIRLLRREVSEGDRLLTNDMYIYYNWLTKMVNIKKFNLKTFKLDSLNDIMPAIKYLSIYYPNILNKYLKYLKELESNVHKFQNK